MKKLTWVAMVGALALTGAGCILTSGQVQISFELPEIIAASPTEIVGQDVNLSDESEYQDNKDKLEAVADVAVLGKFKNNLGSDAINVEVWITRELSTHRTADALTGDVSALKVWGPFTLAPGATKQIDWNDSSKLFSATGRAALLEEAKGDGSFTLYAIGTAGTYNFTVEQGVLVLVIDVGI